MKYLSMAILAILIQNKSIATGGNNKTTSLKWLQTHLKNLHNSTSSAENYETRMCIDYNLKCKGEPKKLNDKIFSTTMRSYVKWHEAELEIENEIIEQGIITETYVYHIPVAAIKKAWLTNCQRNTSENVNAYTFRPIFLEVEKNRVKILHQYTYHEEKTTISLNKNEGDWGTVIPIAGNWDNNETLTNKILQAFEEITKQKSS